jgi:hypothetical protein
MQEVNILPKVPLGQRNSINDTGDLWLNRKEKHNSLGFRALWRSELLVFLDRQIRLYLQEGAIQTSKYHGKGKI